MTAAPAILDRLSALADATRSRTLVVLERHELTVGELCRVLRLPQSTVSRHLKLLGDEGWVSARAEGTTRRYRMPADRLDDDLLRVWKIVRREVAALPAAAQDARRLASVLSERTTRSREFFSSAAGQWDRLRADLFGARAELLGLLGLLDDRWTVGDLGCGTGQVSASLAPFVRRVVAVDHSPEMLGAARARLEGVAGVEVREGELEALPVRDGELDAAVLFLVLPYLPEPGAAIAEAFRALRPGGRLLVVDVTPHDREEYAETMGHLWPGFDEERIAAWMGDAGFHAPRYHPLPTDAAAKGPALFAAGARRPE